MIRSLVVLNICRYVFMHKNPRMLAVIFGINVMSSLGFAQLDAASQEALEKTQSMLTDTSGRQQFQNNNPEAQKVDRDVDSLAGNSQNKEAIFQAASQIFADMAKESNGDADQMKKIIEAAQNNPQGFYMNSVSSSNKALIEKIANDIQKMQVDSHKP